MAAENESDSERNLGLATLHAITSYLETHNTNDIIINLCDLGLINLPHEFGGYQRMDYLLALATKMFGHRVYNPTCQIFILLLKTLLQNGACISTMWLRGGRGNTPFVDMMFWREMETGLDDIKYLIEEKNVLSNLREYDLGECFKFVIHRGNMPLLRLLIENGAIMPSGSVIGDLQWIFVRQPSANGLLIKNNTIEIGRIFDLMLEGKTTVDLTNIAPLNAILPEVPLTVLQWPISWFLYEDRIKLDNLDEYEKDWDFLLGKGHLAPPPEAFTCALDKGSLTYIFTAVYFCLARGIELEFPDLRNEDKAEFNWDDADDRTKKMALLLEEMIHRSGCYCPHSFLLTLSEIRRTGPKFPSLKNISVGAIRKSLLVPDMEERFPDSFRVLRDIPVKPRLIVPGEVQRMIPELLCDLVLLKDLRKGVPDVTEHVNETEADSDSEPD